MGHSLVRGEQGPQQRLCKLKTITITIDPAEVEFTAIRAQGAGGQNVNKVSSAAHLRFDIHASSLPDEVKQRLLALADQRITAEGPPAAPGVALPPATAVR